tara:strand:+ start:10502 stop:11113 length:612 start_codon:yes stop_codon:yes gene_type:complete
MCFGDGGAGAMKDEASRQRAEEEARQGRIRAGRKKIDDTFSSFDDAFYDKRRQSYLDYANPQLDDQYKKAVSELTLALARNSLSNSSVAARKNAELQKQQGIQARAVADKAREYETGTRSAVNMAKSDLQTQNMSLADPTLIAQNAANRAIALTDLPAYSPLGALFANATAGLATQMDLERRDKNRYDLSGLFGSSDSSKVVS